MTPIGVYDAKTQLPKLLERVRRGERFVITKHGRPVAQLVPAEADRQQAPLGAAGGPRRRRGADRVVLRGRPEPKP